MSEAVADIAVVKQSGGAPHIGLGWGQRRRRITEEGRGLGMLSASTPCGWENSAVSMATVRLEEGAQHLGIDGSEKQAEVSG